MLTLQIKEKEIENLTPKEEFLRGTVGAKCQINFDEFWQSYNKYIVFKRVGYEPINFMVDTLENEIEIPYTILAESGEFKIGVFGITETETLPTLYSKDIKILYGTDTHGTTPPTYIPSEIDQLRLSKQDKLVSGENIKTVNGESVLGSGNIKIQVEADQNYDPTSKNAQSGIAVKQAVDGVNTRVNNEFTNALKGNKSGSVFLINDVSPVSHEMGVKVSSKNLWQNTNTTFPAGLSYNSDTQTYTMSTGTTGFNFIAHKFTNPIPVGTTVTISIMFQSGKGRAVAIGGYHRTGGSSWQGYINVPVNVDMSGQTLTSTFTTTETVEEFMIFHNTGDNIEEPFIFKVQYELGTTATSYTPYISDLTSIIVTRYGTFETDSPQTYIPAADGTISGVKSLYPTTTLMTNTEGAIIDAEYNRDINKAFAALEAAIATNNS